MPLKVRFPVARSVTTAVRFVEGTDERQIEGLLLPYGGPFNGRDLHRTFFSVRTDFALNWFSERPLLYQHGLDSDLQASPVGRINALELRDAGGWMKAQLDDSNEYFESIRELVKSGKLFLSSGAMSHLVQENKSTGEITRWPVVEGSLTPTPSNLLATVEVADAAKHFRSVGLELSPELPQVDAATRFWVGALEGSYEDLIEDLSEALTPNAYGPECALVLATFPTYAIVAQYDDGEAEYFRVEYTIGADQEPIITGMAPVEPGFFAAVEADAAQSDDAGLMSARSGNATLRVLPLALHAHRVGIQAAGLCERTKDLAESRIREGRVLSAANRKVLTDARDALQNAVGVLADLLGRTDPAAKAVEVTQLLARANALRLFDATLPAVRELEKVTA